VKPVALIMMAGFIALAGFACVPPQPAELKVGQACQNGVLNVRFLAEPFTPGDYRQDPQVDPTAVDPNILADMTAAFNAAPPSFKDQLCSLNGIFISRHGCTGYDPSTCNLRDDEIADNSWGFREPDGDKYIGISLGLWNNNVCQGSQRFCAPPFQTYHTRLLRALLDHTARDKLPSIPAGYQLPTNFASPTVSPNTSAMSVLATLAHEFGHIYWWHNFVEPPGSEHANPTPAGFCGGSFYPGGRWEGTVVDVPPHRWVPNPACLTWRNLLVCWVRALTTMPQRISTEYTPAGDGRAHWLHIRRTRTSWRPSNYTCSSMPILDCKP
jgi:hypothetical protein